MSKEKSARYPGTVAFNPTQKNIFYGRRKDIEILYGLITNYKLSLLYAKSGLGKSSLINAGLIPRIESSNIKIYNIRFNVFYNESDDKNLENSNKELPTPKTPIETIIERIVKEIEDSSVSWLDATTPNRKIASDTKYKKPLWYYLKRLHLENPNKTFLFIFDQFEELFTYHKIARDEFKQQWSDVLYKNTPTEVWQKYDKLKREASPKLPADTELEELEKDIPVKVLLAIREDKYSSLNELKDYLPAITKFRYALKPLSQEQAERAIVEPAKLEDRALFHSAPFEYEEEALDNIINFLTKKGEQAIETTQLQILCKHLEKLNKRSITSKDTQKGEMKNMLFNFYQNTINLLEESQQLPARKFIEEHLIRNGQRIALDKNYINNIEGLKISENILVELIKVHLLREEKNTLGKSIEIAHDTLVPSILIAKQEREEKEKEERLKKEEVEKLKRLKKEEVEKLKRLKKEEAEKRKKQSFITIISLLFLTLLFSIFAIPRLYFDQGSLENDSDIRASKEKYKEEIISEKQAGFLQDSLENAIKKYEEIGVSSLEKQDRLKEYVEKLQQQNINLLRLLRVSRDSLNKLNEMVSALNGGLNNLQQANENIKNRQELQEKKEAILRKYNFMEKFPDVMSVTLGSRAISINTEYQADKYILGTYRQDYRFLSQLMNYLLSDISKENIDITITGKADATKNKGKLNIKSKQEIKNFQYYNLNGRKSDTANITRNQQISNHELGFLRAYNASLAIINNLNVSKDNIDLKVLESDKILGTYRGIKVELKIINLGNNEKQDLRNKINELKRDIYEFKSLEEKEKNL